MPKRELKRINNKKIMSNETQMAIVPNVCYAFVLFHKSIINKQKIKLCQN